jgi:uncharacterized membrane protein
MKRTKPDLISILVVIFGLGLVLSGFTSQDNQQNTLSSKAIETTVYSSVR